MKKFHVNFKLDGDANISRGENFEAEGPIEALGMFQKEYPTAVFLAIYSIEDISMLTSHQLEYDRKFPNPNSL